MPKTKRPHHRSAERRAVESDEQLSNQSIVSDESDEIVEQKKRHRKKSSKKAKKHRSKRKHSPSDSDSDSSDSSNSSSDSSSEEEVVKRKKQKKHKKSKRRSKHDASSTERKADRDDTEVQILQEPPKVHYISSDEDRHHAKSLKRLDDRKRTREPITDDRGLDYKSRWDSPTDDHERKRKRESPIDRRVEEKYRPEQRGPGDGFRAGSFRERNERIDRNDRIERGRQSPRGAPRPDREQRIDRRPIESDFRRDRRDDANQAEWRGRDRAQEAPDRYRQNKDEREPNRDRRFRPDEGRFNRVENDRRRSISPKGNVNRGRFEDRRDDRRFGYNDNRRDGREPMRGGGVGGGGGGSGPSGPSGGAGAGERSLPDRRPEIKREFNDRDMDRGRNERPRNDFARNRNNDTRDARDTRDTRDRRSPRRSSDRATDRRSPMRSNPFRRNKNPEDHSDFRHDGQRPDRNDRNDKNDRNERNDRNDKNERDDRNPKNGSGPNRRRFDNKESDNENYEWGKPSTVDKKDAIDNKSDEDGKEKEKPNFGLSGKLTEDTNKVNGVVVKYAEPPEARRPKRKWRLYPFKNDQSLNTIYIHRQSCFLIGREKKICEIAVDHPSCSKQHAALQYRAVNYERDDGSAGKRVRPYIIDLESANGTFVNNKKIEPRKYYELFEKDILKFGFSSREYVVLHEDSNVDDDEPGYDEEPIKTEK